MDREIRHRVECRPPEHDVDGAGIASAGVVPGSGGEHVGVSVAVHVSGATHHPAELIACVGIRENPIRDRVGSAPAKEDVGASSLRSVIRRAHDHVAEAIPIHISGRRHGVSEPGARAFAVQRDIRRRVE